MGKNFKMPKWVMVLTAVLAILFLYGGISDSSGEEASVRTALVEISTASTVPTEAKAFLPEPEETYRSSERLLEMVAIETTAPPPTEAPAEAAKPIPVGVEYILNTNSRKFHYPDCASVGDMKPSNKKEFTGDRDEVLNMGYVPCKRCNP